MHVADQTGTAQDTGISGRLQHVPPGLTARHGKHQALTLQLLTRLDAMLLQRLS